eukprot:CAMPEP_0117518142 /NCGR_PEP_ID=MMETSP0784-20121206/31980_1 /TAXON_ID=39447 /ORGANISM="" /LENGTH=62 /DNA_ID=CAMNT_0005314055 /DNA_START=47 /DNA_END=232 /DNA_ORIENTATION=-
MARSLALPAALLAFVVYGVALLTVSLRAPAPPAFLSPAMVAGRREVLAATFGAAAAAATLGS